MEILVKVIPWSKKIDITYEWKDIIFNKDVYKIKLTAKPVNNDANKQLIEVLEKYFKIKKRFITIKQGKTSRIKIIQIDI